MTYGRVLSWFRSRPQREQWLLMAAGIAVLFYLLWFVLLQPVLQARDTSARRLLQAQESLLVVSDLAANLQQARLATPATPGSGRNLAQWLDESSIRQGLRLSALEPASDNSSVSVRMDAVAMTQVLAWLNEVEHSGWISIESVSVTSARSEGDVAVSLRVRTR